MVSTRETNALSGEWPNREQTTTTGSNKKWFGAGGGFDPRKKDSK